MKKYEIMFIVRPTLTEEEIKNVAKKFETILTDNGAKVTNTKDMGQRELAYEIKKFKTGYYFLYIVEANSDAINEFDRVVRINEKVIRHLIVKVED